ncbi:hypothetical protein K9U34_04840 [Lawsonia intracellularis]|nr:hypothetical protein C4K43_05800 [Lawsonia intracellularis]MBZ3892918.1 hypothetical protein [Lawsonia intracellularis]RBN33426.1 hypothetical protein DR194_00580 [Lawsonia intracellularis]RBN35374.1 hypothetical protein DR192_02675 [Lawsonia intracellularis]RBN35988.1 hypothetical protein DR193_00580 [Lawsonia intracellularis]
MFNRARGTLVVVSK